jgi:serine protease inhibitor ecotin
MNFRALSLPALILILAFAATAVTWLRGAYGAQPIEQQAPVPRAESAAAPC